MAYSTKATIGVVIGAIVVLLIIFAIFQATNDEPNDAATNVSDSATQQLDDITNEDEDTIEQITENPDQYYGETITLAGTIQDVYADRVFKLSKDTVGNELLVLTRRDLTEEQLREAEVLLESNPAVTATGTLRQLIVADIEQEYSVDFPEEVEVEFTNRPVLIADNFTFTDSDTILDFSEDANEE